MKLLIKNGYVVDMTDKKEINVKDILVEDDKIVKIEENISDEAEKAIDASGKVVMPGFINTHQHCAMSLFRGYADDSELMYWLENKVWPIEDKLTPEEMYYGSMLSAVEMIKSGTTTFNDMYFFMNQTAKAAEELNIRAVLGRCIMAVDGEDDVRVKEAVDLYEKYNGACNGKVTVNIAPHALYTCNEKAIKLSKKLAKKYNATLHIHLDETKAEHENIKKKYGKTPTEMLKEFGVLDECHTVLAHAVWLEDSDIELLKNMKGGIAHCPISNSKLASGIAPVTKFNKAGIAISLGTDGAGSTNNLDMFEEMRVCAYLQKVSTLDATSISAHDVLKMATINGAKVLGLEESIGTLEVGKKADIIVVNINGVGKAPLNDIYSNLVYTANGADVEHTIIDGKVVMENRNIESVDEDFIIDKCNKIADKYFRS